MTEAAAMRRLLGAGERSERAPGDLLAQALGTELTRRQGELMRLYYIKRMPMTEIAKLLGVNVSTVSRTLARGRKRLARCLKYGSHGLLKAYLE